MIRIVNMIPNALSGETNQDSEPNLAVNPARPTDMVATAFTPAISGAFAPIYVSTDGGKTWSLRNVVPGNNTGSGTGDISVGFATSGGMLYCGTLNGRTGRLNILRTAAFASATPMTLLVDRDGEDQPWVVAGSVVVAPGVSKDRVYVGNNETGLPTGKTATVDRSQDAAAAPAPAGFAPARVERRATIGQDGPPTRIALHADGTVYAVFQRWASATDLENLTDLKVDVTVARDDAWGAGPNAFSALVDAADHAIGQRIATGRLMPFNAQMGQERLGADLAISVDPQNSARVFVAWCDRVGGVQGTDWTLHVRRSTDRGQTWSADLRTLPNCKNPALAVNGSGLVGLLYQQFTGSRWVTQLETTADGWATPPTALVLHRAPSATPLANGLPYLGDYVRMLCIGNDFYGVFCGNNKPDPANFPNNVTYQRNANWTTHVLLDVNNASPVAVSIDPFFFQHTP